MKKIISIVISLALLATAFLLIPLNTVATETAQSEPTVITSIDFEYEAGGTYNYYGGDGSSYPSFVDSDAEHGKAYKLYFNRPASEGGHRGYLLRNYATNEPLSLSYGTNYRITLDYKIIQSKDRYRTLGIWWMNSPVSNTDNTKVRYDFNGRYTPIETIENNRTDSNWSEATAIITPPDSTYTYPVLVLYNYVQLNNKNGDDMLIDNIKVTEYDFKTAGSTDFSYEKNNGYKYKTNDSNSLTTFDNSDVFRVSVMGNYEGLSYRSYALREEGTGYPLPLNIGEDYKLTFKYYNKKSSVDYNIAIAWVANPSILRLQGLPSYYIATEVGRTYEYNLAGVENTYNPIEASPYIQDIATVKANPNGEAEWIDITASISPYSKEKMYPVLFVYTPSNKNVAYRDQEIYFDDISVSNEKINVVTSIDFNKELNGEYNGLKDGRSEFKDLDGNAVYSVKTVFAYADIKTSGYILRDSNSVTNDKLKLEYGKYYNVELDFKKVSVAARWHVIAISWLDNLENYPSDNTFNLSNQPVSVLEIFKDNDGNSNWQSANAVITPPDSEHLYPVLVVYNYGMQSTSTQLYIDNILVTDYEFKDSTYIDFDYEYSGNYEYYFNETNSAKSANTFTNLYDEKTQSDYHSSVFNVSTIRGGDGDARTYAIRQAFSKSPMALKYGETYDIELSYLINKASNSYDISIAWVKNPSIVNLSGIPTKYLVNGTVAKENIPGVSNTYFPLQNNNLIEDLAINIIRDIDGGNSWVTVNDTITPPDNQHIYPVLFIRPKDNLGTHTGQYISIDNISIVKQNGRTVNTANVDLTSNRQADFYSAKTNITGEALLFSQGVTVSGDTATFSGVNATSTDVALANALAISTTQGNNYARYKAGDKLYFTANVNPGSNSGSLKLGIAYADIIIADGVQTAGTLAELAESGKLLEVTDIDTTVQGERQVNGVISIPEHDSYENMYIVLYSENASDATVTVKNITLGNADSNFDNNVNIVDLVKMKKSAADTANCNYDINADGIFNTVDLAILRKFLLK